MNREGQREVDAPVVIVGSGPVGLAHSIELSRFGVDHLVLGLEMTTAQHPKANAINARSMEHFRRLGLARKVRAEGLPLDYPIHIAYMTRLNGTELARFKLATRGQAIQAAADGTSLGWPTPEHPHSLSQIFLEKILLDAASDSAHSDIRLGWEVTSVTEYEEFVEVQARERVTGVEHQFTTRWLVGCDGARSAVRSSMGVNYEGDCKKRSYLGGSTVAIYIESDELEQILSGHEALMYQVFNGELRAGGFSINGSNRFVFHFQAPEGTDPEALDARSYFDALAGQKFQYKVLSRLVWSAGLTLVAESMSTNRRFLAGDAAHLFTPTGGLGMNTGFDEAANLSWKLAATEHGWGGPVLLGTYATERRPVAVRNVNAASRIADIIVGLEVPAAIEDSGAAGEAARKLAGEKITAAVTEEALTRGLQFGVRYDDSPIIIADGTPAPSDSPTNYVPTARPGSRLPHFKLAEGPIYDQLGPWFTLLCIGVPTESAVSGFDLESLSIPVTLKRVDHVGLSKAYGAVYVLVRPDQHVAWRGMQPPADLQGILEIASGTVWHRQSVTPEAPPR